MYYSPKGYWKGLAAIKNLSKTARVSEDVAREWLHKQAIWQIYLPPPKHIPRQKFDIRVPNNTHQIDLLYLSHDKVSGKTFKYALTVVDVASRYKAAEPFSSKYATDVAQALSRIYKKTMLNWPKQIQCD